MPAEQEIELVERKCDTCGAAMTLVSTLPQTDRFPMQRVYKCTQ